MSARSSSARSKGHTGQAVTGAVPPGRWPANGTACTGWAGRPGVRWGTAGSALDLDPGDRLVEALAEQARAAVAAREADVIVLGCTGMPGVAAALQERLAAEGPFVPVVDPTGAAIMWLESQVRLGVRPSRTTYLPPRPKDRIV